MNYVKSLNLFGVEAKEIPCITDSGVPTNSTVGDVGMFYMDTDTGDVYKCVAVNGNAYTWEPMESGNASSGGNVDYGEENAGKLLYVGADGTATVLTLGAGLAIVSGVLTITSQVVTSAICGQAVCGNVICGGA